MTLRIHWICLLLVVLALPCSAKEGTCPPPCKNLSAFIFNDRFCCQRKENKEVRCTAYTWVQDHRQPNRPPHCDKNQAVDVDYFDLPDYKPFNPLQDAQKHLKACHRDEVCQVYQCSNSSIAIFLAYQIPTSYITSFLYHPNSLSFISVDSLLPYDLNSNDYMIKEVLHSLEGYLCQDFDPKKFLDTLQAPAFSFPDRRGQTKEEPSDIQSQPQPKTPVETPSKPAVTISKPNPQTPITQSSVSIGKRTPSIRTTPSNSLPSDAAFRLANVVFYAVLSPVQNVRRYESADKKVELKLIFKAGNKSAFQRQLNQTFANFSMKQTPCTNESTLFEFSNGALYKAFLLHPSAILSWEESAYPAALSDKKSENRKRQELCNINPIQFWNK